MQFPKAISVKAIEKYQIQVTFDDGLTGLLDLNHLAGKGVFKVWDEGNNFFNVYIDAEGGIAWNPDLDICPNNAWLTIKGISFEEWRSLNKPHATNF